MFGYSYEKRKGHVLRGIVFREVSQDPHSEGTNSIYQLHISVSRIVLGFLFNMKVCPLPERNYHID